MKLKIKSVALFFILFLLIGNEQLYGGDTMMSENNNLDVIKQQNTIIDQLINNFKISEDKEYKISVLYTLGELRAKIAVPLLVENLTYGIDESSKRLPKYSDPAVHALAKIGIPSIKPILEFIKSNANDFKLALACNALIGIDGCDLAIFYVQKEINKTKDSEHVAKLNQAIKIIESVKEKAK